jgi:hypothetical protein
MFGGVKFKGFSIDVDVYSRWVNHLQTTAYIPITLFRDNGFTAQMAYYILRKKLEVHAMGSYINGQYGKPYDLIGGLNFFPFSSRTVRLNADARYTWHSPVGYLAFPTFVGTTGVVYIFNLEINF